MIQIQKIREQKDHVIARLAVKNFDAKGTVDQILEIDEARRTVQKELDTLLPESNQLARQIGEMMKSGRKAEAEDLKNKSSALKESAKALNERLAGLEKQQQDLLVKLPNLPGEKVPPGKTPDDNEKIHEEGQA